MSSICINKLTVKAKNEKALFHFKQAMKYKTKNHFTNLSFQEQYKKVDPTPPLTKWGVAGNAQNVTKWADVSVIESDIFFTTENHAPTEWFKQLKISYPEIEFTLLHFIPAGVIITDYAIVGPQGIIVKKNSKTNHPYEEFFRTHFDNKKVSKIKNGILRKIVEEFIFFIK